MVSTICCNCQIAELLNIFSIVTYWGDIIFQKMSTLTLGYTLQENFRFLLQEYIYLWEIEITGSNVFFCDQLEVLACIAKGWRYSSMCSCIFKGMGCYRSLINVCPVIQCGTTEWQEHAPTTLCPVTTTQHHTQSDIETNLLVRTNNNNKKLY